MTGKAVKTDAGKPPTWRREAVGLENTKKGRCVMH